MGNKKSNVDDRGRKLVDGIGKRVNFACKGNIITKSDSYYNRPTPPQPKKRNDYSAKYDTFTNHHSQDKTIVIINVDCTLIYYENRRILTDIFKSLEWNIENKRRVIELERNIKCDRKAREDVQLLIQKFVEANKANNSLTSKLKKFALNALNGASGNIIASAILAAL